MDNVEFSINEPINVINLTEIANRVRESANHYNLKEYIKPETNLKNTSNDILFQILDWHVYGGDEDNKQYTIRTFGRTADNRTICATFENYKPFFYVEIPTNWPNEFIDQLISAVKKKVYPRENSENLVRYNVVDSNRFWGFTNNETFKFIELVFKDLQTMKSYEKVFKRPLKVYGISQDEFCLQLYESNIEPFLRFMHIRNLEAVGWVKIKANKYKIHTDDAQDIKSTLQEINIRCDWNEANRYDSDMLMPYTIMSFDIECDSTDGTFPQAYRDGDKIIQIGSVFCRFGEDECYYKHIITLGTCNPIPDVEIESYATEQEVLLAWTSLVMRTNPDIVTGYNIFGFDFQYMKDRAKKLGVYERFSKLSRILDTSSEWQEKKLASSALGDNLMKYFDMNGRILIDMMKVVQRDFNLASSKLDYVASYFIKEDVLEFIMTDEMKKNKETYIKTKKTYGVKEGQYITINYTDGITVNKHMDGKKFMIKNMGSDYLLVNGIIETTSIKDKGYEIFWSQAKDDLPPKEIFRLQKGTAKDRAKIAKYCIMDCVLVIKLMAKVQTIVQNIGMANVCHVPLSYLFMRGQGIKIFSLVSKKCREEKHKIPTMIKEFKNEEEEKEAEEDDKKMLKLIARLNGEEEAEEDDDEDDGYEGAIVFPPEPGVYYEPIPVLDYASLYPRSMIYKNLSHECNVMDDAKYGYLPNYKYHVTTYKTTEIKHQYERKLLNKLVDAFTDNKDYIVEELPADPSKYRRNVNVYDKDHNKKKRWIIANIVATRDEIILTNYKTSKFAEKKDGTKGIIPVILQELLDARSRYKDEMEAEKDPFKKSILNGRQLAYKVTANSLYGQTGSTVSPICMKMIAETTTATGREMLIFSKNFIEGKFGKLVNLALTNRTAFDTYANELFKDVPIHKFYKPNEKKPEEGWTTKEEFCDKLVKEMQASLSGKTIDPYIVYGDSVTKDTPILLRKDGEINIKTIETLGKEWKEYNAFKCDVVGLTDKQQDDKIDYEVWTDKGWAKIKRVIRHKTNKQIYEVLTHTGCVRVTEDHSLLTPQGLQIKPIDCKIGTELLHAFPEMKISNNSIEYYYEITNQLDGMKQYYMMKENGMNPIINKINNKLIITNTNDTNNKTQIIELNKIDDYDDYVYDLETEVGHFHAGIGEMIVKNTDSVFFNARIKDNITGEIGRDKKALEQCIKLGIWASNVICLILPEPEEQAYEKVLWPFMILSKKRYVGNLYEKNPNKFKQKSMGIVLKRRDNAQCVKVVCGGIVDQILNKRSPDGAVKFTADTLKKILSGKLPMDDFIITKTLRENYVDRTKHPHVVLADRIAQRDPGNKPLPNDRIPYAYIIVKGNPELQGDRVESPDYIINNGLKLDYIFYITNQIEKPASQFLSLVIDNPEKIFESYIMREMNRRKGIKSIKAYLTNENYNTNDDIIFDNDDQTRLLDDNDKDNDSNSNLKKKKARTSKTQTKSKIKKEQIELSDSLFLTD